MMDQLAQIGSFAWAVILTVYLIVGSAIGGDEWEKKKWREIDWYLRIPMTIVMTLVAIIVAGISGSMIVALVLAAGHVLKFLS